jgi:hypothetical protein
MKNITFTADERMISLARERATREKKALNQVFRDWLYSYAGRNSSSKNYKNIMDELSYARPGRKFTRDELNER